MKTRRHLASLILGLTAAATSLSHADAFTLLIYESPADLAARTDPQRSAAYWGGYNSYAKQLLDAGVMRGGTALPGAAGGKSVALQEGQPAVLVNANPASDQQLGGYFIIEVADFAAALDWAKRAPGLRTGHVEVLPHVANPTMPAK